MSDEIELSHPRDDHKNIVRYSDWLDTKFRIPGTRIRFGLDFIIGLVPIAGDVLSFSLSGGLLLLMIKKGASGKALILMILNILLDTTLGSVPIIGDLFDLFFKANRRNLDLFQAHFEEGKHQGSAWPIILTIMIVLLVLIALLIYGLFKIFGLLLELLI